MQPVNTSIQKRMFSPILGAHSALRFFRPPRTASEPQEITSHRPH